MRQYVSIHGVEPEEISVHKVNDDSAWIEICQNGRSLTLHLDKAAFAKLSDLAGQAVRMLDWQESLQADLQQAHDWL